MRLTAWPAATTGRGSTGPDRASSRGSPARSIRWLRAWKPTHAADAPAQIEADPVRLAEILMNLVANAVQHTPRAGHVTLRVSGAGDASLFEVEDTGPGFPADQLPFVFDRFVTSADTVGTGLG